MAQKILAFCIIFCLFFSVAIAQNENQNNQQPTNNLGPSFDFGMPQGSAADPEYVAQQKMIEGMTTAYNWIALNSTKFAEGCKTNKNDLVTQISTVVQQAQETSSVCEQFSAEAQSCNPETFCSKFSNGQLPLPPQAITELKKEGYDTKNLKVTDITQEMIIKVCLAQANPEIENRKQMLEATKEKIKGQLPAFKAKCEEFKKNNQTGPNIKLPDIQTFPDQKYVQQGPMQQGNGGQCQEPHPDCGGNGAPFCQNGNWVCPPQEQQQIAPQEPQQNQEPPQQPNPPQEIQNPNPQPPQQPAPEQTPTNNPPAENPPIQTIGYPLSKIFSTITGFVTGTSAPVCGNGVCEPDLGENPGNCQQDCMQQGYNPQGFNNPQPNQQNQNQQMNQQPGINPQELCNMTDEEIIDYYTRGMDSGMPNQAQMESQCKTEAGRMLQEMNRYKMEIARCKADAALDCEAKQQALKNCNELKDSPEKTATMIVQNMCRRFGTTTTEEAKSKLYEAANKWYETDPALANQLGDTADKTISDQKSLGVLSYFFGNGDYAQKLKDRADKLKEVKQRLVEKNSTDTETLSILETQIQELDTEASKFSNLLDLTRIGYMFR